MCLCLGVCIVKYILTTINLILTLVGLAITAVGSFLLIKLRSANVEELPDVDIIPTIIIVVGCVTTVIFFLGCCGAITKNTCMLISYSVIIVILASLTVAVTVILSKNKSKVEDITNEITEIFDQSKENSFLNFLESTLECCGTTGPDSYVNSNIPLSCCPDTSNLQNIQNIATQGVIISSSTVDLTCDIKDAYQDGCVTKFTDMIKNVLQTVETVLICICIAEYIAGAMAICLTCHIKRKK